MLISYLFRQIILPYTLAFLLILSYAYDLDPLMVFWGVSETVCRYD
jgi:predicted transcriptional regulator